MNLLPPPPCPPFPSWFLNGEVIGTNTDDELLAVGLHASEGYTAWLVRLSKHSGMWCSVREATKAQIALYDEVLLKCWGISLDDPQ